MDGRPWPRFNGGGHPKLNGCGGGGAGYRKLDGWNGSARTAVGGKVDAEPVTKTDCAGGDKGGAEPMTKLSCANGSGGDVERVAGYRVFFLSEVKSSTPCSNLRVLCSCLRCPVS